MIIPMKKYTFLIYHEEYFSFLKELQDLGVLHIIEREKDINDGLDEKHQLLNKIDKVIKFLEKRDVEPAGNCSYSNAQEVITDILNKQNELAGLKQELANVQKELINAAPWGSFSRETIDELNKNGLFLRFFSVSKKKFDENLIKNHHLDIISEDKRNIYFVVVQNEKEELNIEAEEVTLPRYSLTEIKTKEKEIEKQIEKTNRIFDHYSQTCVPLIKRERNAVFSNKKYFEVAKNAQEVADGKTKILEGWVPDSKKEQIIQFLNNNETYYYIEDATPDEPVPVLLKNNRFGKLFEPIGKLFSLPSYSELDLTVLFAPFFMLFFGFCLGDAGYGLLFILGAGLYKIKAKQEIKPMLSLVQILGMATVLFGIISGTFFGINLIDAEIAILKNYKELFLEPDNMFNLALVLGALQIVFGIAVKAANQIKQYGIMHALATFGWLIILVGSAIYFLLTESGYLASNSAIIYSIISLGGFLILFFSDVNKGIAVRIGKGVWDIYSTVTGIFGDLLSYIRLFALGLSSAILGFVINDIALQILDSSPIIGPVFFVIFLLLGHGLNILISSLGSFVHPMRLTFVEFYKNAGFTGGGKAYNPFSKALETK
jgi:V/A-type H+-transporting ATPase subunit I